MLSPTLLQSGTSDSRQIILSMAEDPRVILRVNLRIGSGRRLPETAVFYLSRSRR